MGVWCVVTFTEYEDYLLTRLASIPDIRPYRVDKRALAISAGRTYYPILIIYFGDTVNTYC